MVLRLHDLAVRLIGLVLFLPWPQQPLQVLVIRELGAQYEQVRPTFARPPQVVRPPSIVVLLRLAPQQLGIPFRAPLARQPLVRRHQQVPRQVRLRVARKVAQMVAQMVARKVGPMVDHSEVLMVAQMEGRLEGPWGPELARLILMWFQRVIPPLLVLQK